MGGTEILVRTGLAGGGAGAAFSRTGAAFGATGGGGTGCLMRVIAALIRAATTRAFFNGLAFFEAVVLGLAGNSSFALARVRFADAFAFLGFSGFIPWVWNDWL